MLIVVGLLAAAAALLLLTTRSSAQVQEGATMTVLRGQVAVVHSDGSAVQPAPSGTVVVPGDEIRTLGSTSALITFFAGTEIELEQNTTIAVEAVSRQGDRIDVSLKQAFGATVNRVQTLSGSGSTYRIEAGGAVALVRGTTFVIIGPITTSAGDIVILVCGADCSPASTFAGCGMQPFLGYAVAVERGRVESSCIPFAVSRTADLLSAAFEAITTIEQQLQGETRGIPPGQVQGGQQQEIENRDRKQEDDDDKSNEGPASVAVPNVSINDVAVNEGASATFTVSLSAPSSLPVTVNVATANGTATAPADYTAASSSLTIPAGATSGTVTIPTAADLVVEPPENFAVNLSGAVNATITDPQGVGTIVDVGTLTLSINDVTVTEGNIATFTVTLSAPGSVPVTVNFATANGTATAPADYVATSGTLTFPPGTTTQTISVQTVSDTAAAATVGARAIEPAETFFVNLSNPAGATIADPQGQGTIVDPVALTLSINDVTVNEGANAVFTVSLSAPSSVPVTVNFATANGTATAPADYTAASSSLTIPAGATSGAITIPTAADGVVEPPENFAVNLSLPPGATATLADNQGVGTIVDPGTLTLSINDASATEGGNVSFTVTLSAPSSVPVTVNFATADGTGLAGAIAPGDYTAASNTLTFPPGTTSLPIVIATVDDAIDEVDELFAVNLSGATVATIADPQGVGTILDNDTTAVSINNVSVTEGTGGTTDAVFTLSLSLLSSQNVTVNYSTANGSGPNPAVAPGDYAAVAGGSATIPAGSASAPLAIAIVTDNIDELDETFTVTLSLPPGATFTIGTNPGTGTILDDDTASLSINDVDTDEGNDCEPAFEGGDPIFPPCGTKNFQFTVSLSGPSDREITVNFTIAPGGSSNNATEGAAGSCSSTSTVDGAAASGGIDYEDAFQVTPGQLVFPAGSTTAQFINVPVCADQALAFTGTIEGDQTFVVNLVDPPTGGATIADGQGLGTIRNDDDDFCAECV